MKNCPDKAVANLCRAQGTDGSGITFAKDVTNTTIASADRLREPIPFLCNVQTLNPKSSISVEQVLRYDEYFNFSHCNRILRKQRMVRLGLNTTEIK
jgi:hypothetical protein